MLCVPCYVLLCHAHILEGLYDLISVESNRLLGIRIESIRQNFSPPRAFIHDLTSGKSSSAKGTSGESEVFDPRADSNRLWFKTIRLSLGVLDMSVRGQHRAAYHSAVVRSCVTLPFIMIPLYRCRYLQCFWNFNFIISGDLDRRVKSYVKRLLNTIQCLVLPLQLQAS